MKLQFSPGRLALLLAIASVAGLAACEEEWQPGANVPDIEHRLPAGQFNDWPRIPSSIRQDPQIEAEIARIAAGMSLEEKVGQMTQPEIKAITPDEVRRYYIGSVLNGGGSWPGNNKRATVADWLALADAYWQASMTTNGRVKIPVIWGTDAVHGHGNVYGATLFPHNIGLGAANDPDLIYRIGLATAQQVVATGIDWTFAPTLAVVRDDRWGRTYEGYGEHPYLVRRLAWPMVKGLQGDFHRSQSVIATAKHFMGDGGTDQGKDQGVTMASKRDMINIHGQGYYTALAAGAQTVMASFNSWTNEAAGIREGKMHGSKTMLTDVLKNKMGFDGFVVSDWNGVAQVPGCSNYRCAQAINAGIDMVMVPDDWKLFIENTVDQVRKGEIPMARIDDAVTRILRVKMRAGLFKAPMPSKRLGAGDSKALVHRVLAREAVQKSLVLLKNNGGVLPLKRGEKILVVGKSADNLTNQTGGWSLSWQGTGNTNADFPNADTILAGIQEAAGAGNMTYSQTGQGVDVSGYKAVIAVIGETPYAEGVGDIGRTGTLEHARRYPEDLAVLNNVAGKGVPVVTVLVSGRPVWVNKELNRSDAFVMAALPGTEGKGVADVLFRNAAGIINKPFTGRLSYSWPKTACQVPLNWGDVGYSPLFAYGFGLSYGKPSHLGQLDETAPVLGCGQTDGGGGKATEDLEVFKQTDKPPYALYIGSPENWGGTALGNDPNAVITHGNLKAETTQVNIQQDAKKITWNGNGPGQFYAQSKETVDRQDYLNADSALVFDSIVEKAPDGLVKVRVDCKYPCVGEVDATNVFKRLADRQKHKVKIPLACFSQKGTDFATIDTPLLIFTDKAFIAAFADIRWVPNAGKDADAVACSELVPPPPSYPDPIPGPQYNVFTNGQPASGFASGSWSTNGTHVEHVVQAGGELRLSFKADGGNGLFYLTGNPVNLSNFAQGKLTFDILVESYGSNSAGLTVKMESPGNNCNTGDYLFGRPVVGSWQSVSVPIPQLLLAATACFTLQNVGMPFGTLPKWDEQQGVAYQLRNIRMLQ